MCDRPLIRLPHQAAVSRGHAKGVSASEQGQRSKRHRHRNESARLFHDAAKRTVRLTRWVHDLLPRLEVAFFDLAPAPNTRAKIASIFRNCRFRSNARAIAFA